jgi:hypothetical protein
LVNALLGQELAPTDVRECTRVATWYRGSSTCTIRLYPRAGKPRPVEFAATGAAAAVSLGDVALETVDHLVVDWPSPALRAMTLIDLPGTDSLCTNGSEQARALITPARHGIPTVDAIVYLTRRMHASDIRFLEDVRDDPRWRGAVAVVLTRADEAGLARPDALEAAARISAKYRRDPRVRQVCQTVLPVAALLAASGATLSESEYEALRQLSALEEPESDTPLLSADQFAHADRPNTPGPADRARLLERFGIFGVRLAIGLIRQGQVSGPAQLREALLRHSGVQQLRDLLTTQLAARVDALTARSALLAMDAVLAGLPATDPYRDSLLYETERIRVGAHELTEIDLIDSLRCGDLTFPNEDIALAERILGADGTDPFTRLGLSPEAGAVAVEQAAALNLARWQQHAENPLLTRDTYEACRAVIRACEGLLQYSRSVRTE